MDPHPAIVRPVPGGSARRVSAAAGALLAGRRPPRYLRRTEPDLVAVRAAAFVRVGLATCAGMLGSALDGLEPRTEALFLLIGLVWLPWACILLLASDGRGQLALRGGPIGDCLMVFAAQCLLPTAGALVLLAHVLLVCFAASIWRARPAWLLAALSTVLTLFAQTLVPEAERLESPLLVLFGVVLGAVVVLVNRIVSRQGQAAQSSSRMRAKADTILARVADGLIVTDATGTILQCNPAGERLVGPGLRHPVGASCRDALGLHEGERPLDCSGGCPLLSPGAEGRGDDAREVWRLRADGRRQPLLASAAALVAEDGRVAEVVHSVRDITRLKEADEAKTLFLATASHELKTPLTIIGGFAEALLAFPDMSRQQRDDAMRAVHRRTLELRAIVERLLLSSKIESGTVDLSLRRLDLRPVLEERVTALVGATGREVALALPADQGDGLVAVADQAALSTVVDHLLDNAAKYSGPGPLAMGAGRDPDGVRFWVRDEGIGMDPEQAAHCFDKFWQAESSDVRRFGGTGIGLYIVQSLVHAMGGTIEVDSGVGRGTTFTVTLALNLPRPPSEAEARAGRPGIADASVVMELMRQIGVPSRRAG